MHVCYKTGKIIEHFLQIQLSLGGGGGGGELSFGVGFHDLCINPWTINAYTLARAEVAFFLDANTAQNALLYNSFLFCILVHTT